MNVPPNQSLQMRTNQDELVHVERDRGLLTDSQREAEAKLASALQGISGKNEPEPSKKRTWKKPEVRRVFWRTIVPLFVHQFFLTQSSILV